MQSYSSRDDLLDSGDSHAPSRSTVREIPVLRAPSAAASSVLDAYAAQQPPSASLASYHHRDPSGDRDMHDEYYRREVRIFF